MTDVCSQCRFTSDLGCWLGSPHPVKTGLDRNTRIQQNRPGSSPAWTWHETRTNNPPTGKTAGSVIRTWWTITPALAIVDPPRALWSEFPLLADIRAKTVKLRADTIHSCERLVRIPANLPSIFSSLYDSSPQAPPTATVFSCAKTCRFRRLPGLW